MIISFSDYRQFKEMTWLCANFCFLLLAISINDCHLSISIYSTDAQGRVSFEWEGVPILISVIIDLPYFSLSVRRLSFPPFSFLSHRVVCRCLCLLFVYNRVSSVKLGHSGRMK
jgi:hypothetical protein